MTIINNYITLFNYDFDVIPTYTSNLKVFYYHIFIECNTNIIIVSNILMFYLFLMLVINYNNYDKYCD